MTTFRATAIRPAPSSDVRTISRRELLAGAARARAHGYQWKRAYLTRVLIIDTVAVTFAVVLAATGRFGFPVTHPPGTGHAWAAIVGYSVALAVVWLVMLGVRQSRDLSMVGVGSEEYRRVWEATAWVFGIVAAVGLLANEQIARGYLLIVFPVGLLTLTIGRHLLRRSLARQRATGEFMNHVVVLGSPQSVVSLCDSFDRSKSAGYKAIGACLTEGDARPGAVIQTGAGEVPVFGDETAIERALKLTSADVVAVTAAERLGHERMRELAWRLDPLGVDMIVLPAMTDVAGPRLKVRPIDNLPMFHIARPRFDSGYSRYGKLTFDIVVGSLALLVTAPLMLTAALAILLMDGRPVIFRQWRVGRHGKPFRIFKFRTMRVDAEPTVAASPDPHVVFLPKTVEDARVTKLGALLRRTSIDELPQLFNVLTGSMSIVGPRPLALGEGASVEHYLERRGLMKPGMTGLWQVSGRSNASAEERIRLDHSYVDNWSWVRDIIIVLRTVRTVAYRDGAC